MLLKYIIVKPTILKHVVKQNENDVSPLLKEIYFAYVKPDSERILLSTAMKVNCNCSNQTFIKCHSVIRRCSRPESVTNGHVSAYMLDVLHWLPFQHRIIFRIGALVWRCILGHAPAYLRDLCYPTLGTRSHSSLRSLEQRLLFVPFARTSTTQARAFSVVGPSVWNGLPLAQRLLPRILWHILL